MGHSYSFRCLSCYHGYLNSVRDDAIMRVCHKYRPLLCHLNLRGCIHLSSDSLKVIGHCQNLQDLNLSEAQGINVSWCMCQSLNEICVS